MRKNVIRSKRRIFIILTLICVLLFSFGSFFSVPARAEEVRYSDALDDLQVDSAFNASEWEDKKLHPETELIQIAESVDNELYLYVHFVGEIKPVSKVVFNTQTTFEQLDFRSYTVECVSEDGSFCKYLVKNYTTPTKTHIYAISRLEYPVDKIVSATQKVTYEYIAVDQYWTVSYVDGKAEYAQEHLDTIEITDSFVFSYNDGPKDSHGNYTSWSDIFYYAFSTDIDMDDVIEVQIEYQKELVRLKGGSYDPKEIYPEEPINFVVKAEDYAEYEEKVKDYPTLLSWIFWYIPFKPETSTRRFKAISTPEEFREESELEMPKSEKTGKEYDWVVTFYSDTYTPGVLAVYDIPANVSVLRLKYIKDGVIYNVGTLDTRSSYIPPEREDDDKSILEKIWDVLQKIWSVIQWVFEHWYLLVAIAILVVALIVFSPFLPVIGSAIVSAFKAIGHFFLWALKGLWWLISAPFRLIINLFTGGE